MLDFNTKDGLSASYQLLDSGNGEKLERFGDKVLRRPTTLAVWKRRLPAAVWNADAFHFDPDGGWVHQGKPVSGEMVWSVPINGSTFVCRLQRNGQIGIFPEHLLYLPALLKEVLEGCSVLNLFAYTGVASVLLARQGATVTHVELAKSVNAWCIQNIEANKIPRERIRIIAEDVFAFLRKEKKRGNRYQCVIADPPNFSRISKQESWNLEEVLPELWELIRDVLDPLKGQVLLTAHASTLGAAGLANIAKDYLPEPTWQHRGFHLEIPEHESSRALPASVGVWSRKVES